MAYDTIIVNLYDAVHTALGRYDEVTKMKTCLDTPPWRKEIDDLLANVAPMVLSITNGDGITTRIRRVLESGDLCAEAMVSEIGEIVGGVE